jgi:hypothetical protein
MRGLTDEQRKALDAVSPWNVVVNLVLYRVGGTCVASGLQTASARASVARPLDTAEACLWQPLTWTRALARRGGPASPQWQCLCPLSARGGHFFSGAPGGRFGRPRACLGV